MTKTESYLYLVVIALLVVITWSIVFYFAAPPLPPTVEHLQQILVDNGCNIGDKGVDGVLGPDTYDGLKEYYGKAQD